MLGHTLEELAALGDLTLAEYLRYLAAYGGEVQDEDGLLLFAGAHAQPNPYRNGALRLEARLPPDEVLARAARFFGPRGRSYALWAREHGDADLEEAAVAAGLRELERVPEMVLPELLPYLPPPSGVELRRATDPQIREDYLAVIADAWGMAAMPRDVAAKVFFDPDSLDVPNVGAFVAYYDGRPVSAAMTHISHGVALGCQGGTLQHLAPGQRMPDRPVDGETLGLASSCLWAALDLSFTELGARFSLCQTSARGAPRWQAMGYRPFSGYGRYLVPTPTFS